MTLQESPSSAGVVPANHTDGSRVPFSRALAKWALPAILMCFITVFSIWSPDQFLTWSNFRTILVTNAVLAIIAIGITLALIVGELDLSVAANLGLGSILVTGLPSASGWSFGPAVLVALMACVLVGAVNGALIAKVGVNALVVTLGTSTIITGVIQWYSGGAIFYTGIPAVLTDLGRTRIAGIPLPVVYLAAIAVAAWYVLRYTPLGRFLYAIGGSEKAARLSGINVERHVLGVFMAVGLLAGIAGVAAAGILGSGNPNVGPPYLLPAFAAAFLGATAIRPGSYNIWGTVIAVYTLAVGVNGLQTIGAEYYINPIFNGCALILAVIATRLLYRDKVS